MLLDLGDGSWHYNFNIEEIEETVDEVIQAHYEYDTVQVWGPPSYAIIVKAIIRDRYDESREFGIINEYNAHVLGIRINEEAVDVYVDFMAWVMAVKEMVAADL